jgi:hypothetical protein
VKERLISEPLRPLFSAAEAPSQPVGNEFQAVGEPMLPERFVWRGEELAIAEVAEQWKGAAPPGARR